MRTQQHPIAAATIALTLVMCHQPEEPPVSPSPTFPPTPTRPTYGLGNAVAFGPTDTIDASIITDGGGTRDARVLDLDTGASR